MLSSPPETTLNFVYDQEDPVLIADLAEAPQIGRRSGDIPTFTENGLDQNRGNFLGAYLLRKEQVKLVERFFYDFFLRRRRGQGQLVPEREWSDEHRWLRTMIRIRGAVSPGDI